MHQIIDFLKGAVARDSTQAINGCYVIKEGSIYARNMMLQAGISMESAVSFIVPASEFDAALARMPEIQSLTVNADDVVVKCGRLKSTIKLYKSEAPPVPDMPDVWTRSPPGLTNALRLALPFLGDRDWTEGIRLMSDRVTAACNNRGIDIKLPGLEFEEPVLIEKTVAGFLIAQGDPDEYVPSANSVMFRWDDGRWAKAQLLNTVMPDVDRIFNAGGSDTPVALSAEWRQAYDDIVGLGEGKFSMTRAGFKTQKGAADSEVEFPMEELPEDHASYWDSKVLDAMLTCATSWNPAAYPAGALFVGDDLRGMVMGYRA